jgi:hypothetical protein
MTLSQADTFDKQLFAKMGVNTIWLEKLRANPAGLARDYKRDVMALRPSRTAQGWIFHPAEKGIDICDKAPLIEKGGSKS